MIGQEVKGALRWMMLAKGASQLISWLVTLVVIRILSPGDYGLFAMASMLVVLAEMLKEMGLGSALVQTRDLTTMALRQVFTLILLVNAVLFAVIALTAPVMANVFGESDLELLIPILAMQFPIMALETIPEAMLARNMDFRAKALIATAGEVTNSATTLTCALLGLGVWSLIFGSLAAAIVRVISYGLKQSLYFTPTLNFRGVGLLASFGGYVTLSRFLNVLLVQSSFFVVGRVLGKEALGLFSVATQLATLPMQKVSGILNEVGLAAFSRIQDDRPQVAAHYVRAMSILALISFPTFWGLVSVAEPFTEVILGDKWGAIVLPLQIIAFVTPLRMIFNTTTPALLGIGRADIFFSNLLVLNVLMPFACLAGTKWGVNGAAVAWLIAYPPAFLFTQRRSLKCIGVSGMDLFAATRSAAVIAFAMLLLVLGAADWLVADRLGAVMGLIVLVVLGAAFYLVASLRFNHARFAEARALVYR